MSGNERLLRVIALPCGGSVNSESEVDRFVRRRRASGSDLPAAAAKLLRDATPNPGDALLWIDQERIRAIGLVIRVSGTEIVWLQRAWTQESPLDAVPQYKALELKETELQKLVDELAKEDLPADHTARATHPSVLQEARVPSTPAGPSTHESLPPTNVAPPAPQNVILYGPPGTGKTFATARRTLELLRVVGAGQKDNQGRHTMANAQCAEHFAAFQAHGRVTFVTFHQSYGYEEFVEGLRPEVTEGQVTYRVMPGVLKQVADRARRAYEDAASFDVLWKRLLKDLHDAGGTLSAKSSGGKPATLSAGEGGVRVAIEGEPTTASREHVETLWRRRAELPATINTQSIEELLSRHYGARRAPGSTMYPVFMALREREDPLRRAAPQYVLIIDEINRGNISKVFGELITLLEPDKRLGMANPLSLRLAYTPDEAFALPPNLHLLGTMNTADRSIALLDVALRRRFTFEKMPPKPEVLEGPQSDVGNLAATLLKKINPRIRYLLDEDHEIGHAYFVGVDSYVGLRDVFCQRVIPLLFEYFHGSPTQVAAVLGCPVEEDGKPLRKAPWDKERPLLRVVLRTEKEVFGFDDRDIEDQRMECNINPDFEQASETDLPAFFATVS